MIGMSRVEDGVSSHICLPCALLFQSLSRAFPCLVLKVRRRRNCGVSNPNTCLMCMRIACFRVHRRCLAV